MRRKTWCGCWMKLHAIQFNRELLRAALEHLPRHPRWSTRSCAWSPGTIATSSCWNIRKPDQHGRPIEECSATTANAAARRRRGRYRGDDRAAPGAYARGTRYTASAPANGTVIEPAAIPCRAAASSTSYFDVTAYKRAQDELLEANEPWSRAWPSAPAKLTALNLAWPKPASPPTRPNEARPPFSPPQSHDWCSRSTLRACFVPSLERQGAAGSPPPALIGQVENSLTGGGEPVSSCSTISRLDAGAQEAPYEHFDIARAAGARRRRVQRPLARPAAWSLRGRAEPRGGAERSRLLRRCAGRTSSQPVR